MSTNKDSTPLLPRWRIGLNYCRSLVILVTFLALAHVAHEHMFGRFPPALSAMLALFIALQCGVIKLHWLEPTSSTLLNYMPVFFVPAAAQVVKHSDLIHAHWLTLLLCLFIVPLVGLVVIGAIMQLARKL